jgi:hypothetical protein
MVLAISASIRDAVAASPVDGGKKINIDSMCPRQHLLFEFHIRCHGWPRVLEIVPRWVAGPGARVVI